AHQAVLKAKQQVQMLTPLVADGEQYQSMQAQQERWHKARDALGFYFAAIKKDLLLARQQELDQSWQRQDKKVQHSEAARVHARQQEQELRSQIAANGGDRLQRLAQDIAALSQQERERRKRHDRHAELSQALNLTPVQDEEGFMQQQTQLQALQQNLAVQESRLENDLAPLSASFYQGRQDQKALADEIASLSARKSNIPTEFILLRERLAQGLKLAVDDIAELMPFVGELIQIHPNEAVWQGAGERLLRGFGLSLLVPDSHYAAVVDWVERTHLKGRLVYYRVKPGGALADTAKLQRDSLVRKLQIEPHSPFYNWLERELVHRFDYICCQSQEQFRREVRAITQAGQTKTQGERHEKDDRSAINDRSRYVLGWSNAEKIAALNEQRLQLEKTLGLLGAQISSLQRERESTRGQRENLSKLVEFQQYQDIDWHSPAQQGEVLRAEQARLQASSNLLQQLSAQLAQLEQSITQLESDLKEQISKLGGIKNSQQSCAEQLAQLELRLAGPVVVEHGPYFADLDLLRADVLADKRTRVEDCEAHEREMREALQKSRIDSLARKLSALRERIVKAMADYKNSFKLETEEVDANIEALAEFAKMLAALMHDDLPRFEARFKALLNENTIREIANFQSQLARERETIKERIDLINQSLAPIDYNDGRFIVLAAQASPDLDIRDFQNELRACTEGSLGTQDDAQYSETKFAQVQHIIERFRGRAGLAEQDRRWTQKVTDVRNWFVFGASECWRSDGSEHEHYSDSGGKSGGQKEKLAYTILAASLAYQFGLDWERQKSRSFRFVMIDEAFGRGSDESAQYGLRLFGRLGLQLLIITPLQKIHVIEPYVSSVGFVFNEGGSQSRLRHLTIEQYRAEKAKVTS
ncbi:MAG: hypothetical protein RL748_4191, partial [Pseudomonadota bacterium]